MGAGTLLTDINVKRVTETIFIPYSVANALQLYLFTGLTNREAVEILDKEGVLLLLRYLLEKVVKPLYEVKGRVRVEEKRIVIELLEIVSDSKLYEINGEAVIDPFDATLSVGLSVITTRELKIHARKVLETYLLSMSGDMIDLKFYT